MHVSNRYLDLLPPIADLVADAGLAARFREDLTITDELLMRGKAASTWVAIARAEPELGSLGALPEWKKLTSPGAGRVWTDDYSNLVTALRR